ncbi:uncharacterized protein EV154DRAFT_546908 [Mucor mucedo]|uniref:uncharacterized protein n=1 Tax=Mucor mucedo TaxID=29922 RepID=UPI00221F5B15|nr:uncharacterized protein EV154DRAFT_546908 [Mucor mucedo]KAI7897043.1 hypothetical protein EV154DRAFT_546908 [Mucor mucedo]
MHFFSNSLSHPLFGCFLYRCSDTNKEQGVLNKIRVLGVGKVGRTSGYGFVTMKTAEEAKAAMNALNGHELDDIEVVLVTALPEVAVKIIINNGQERKTWSNHMNSTEIMDKFEAITCPWKCLQLTIFATRIISEAEDLVFAKKTVARLNSRNSTLKTHMISVFLNFGHGASFARLLADVLSLSRLVYLNYKKLNSLLQTKQSYSLEQLYFSEDDENILFKSDSNAPDEFFDNRINNTINEGLKERILKKYL